MVPLLQSLREVGTSWAGKEAKRGKDTDNSVVVDVGPDANGVIEAEDYEWDYGVSEDELGREPGCDVVVAFIGRWLGAIRGEEEWADMSAEF
jgi:hypothetical protein